MSAAARLDAASDERALELLLQCCGASRWAQAMLAERPFGSDQALFVAADDAWLHATRDDVLEALRHHPRIGANLDELRKKFAATASWAASEQSGAAAADESTLRALQDGNVRYEARFGHVFVVCATGKTAAEMLALLHARLDNGPDDELLIAKEEQRKITRIRLEKIA